MKEALQKALEMKDGAKESGTDRILAAAFFRTRPLQLGSQANVVRLDERARRRSPEHR